MRGVCVGGVLGMVGRESGSGECLMAGVRRRDPDGFTAFCAGVVLAKVEYRDAKAEDRRPRHGERTGDSDRAVAAVRDRFGGGN